MIPVVSSTALRISRRFVHRNLLFFLASVELASCVLPAQTTSAGRTPYVVSGSVRLPDGAPARRAVVRVTSTTGLDRQTLADDSGHYELRDLPRGRYFLSATNPDDPDQASDYAELDLSRSFSFGININLYLRYKPEKKSQHPAGSPVVSARESAQRIPKQALKAFERGVKFSRGGKLGQAEQEFTEALDLFPEYFQALSERGSLYIAQGRMREASQDFRHALELDPGYGPALRGRGICEFHAGRYSDAASFLEKAVVAEPNVSRDYIFLGLAYAALDRREPARAAYRRALSLDPKGSARAHYHLASLYIRENRPGEAISELDAYLAALPEAPDREKVIALQSQLRRKQ